MIELDTLRSAALSEQPWARLDELVRSELTSGRSTRQIYKNIIGIVREIDDAPGLTEDGRDAIGDTLDGLTGMCHRDCRYRDPPNLTVPSEDEIAELPRWARAAFAARCARRILAKAVGVINSVDLAVLLTTLHSVECSAATASIRVTQAEADAARKVSESTASAAPFAVYTVAAHTLTWNAYPNTVVDAATTVHASATDERLTPFIRRDFDHIEKYADWHRWTDDTPVSPDFFGPLWPEGPPKGWPAGPDVLQRADLPLELLSRAKVLEQMTEDETVNLFNQINAYYIARTGMRLTMEDLRPMVAAGVLAEV